jgi:hypothetical protein
MNRMHKYFVLVRGGRWAGTGSTFRPSSNTGSRPRQSETDSDIAVSNQSMENTLLPVCENSNTVSMPAVESAPSSELHFSAAPQIKPPPASSSSPPRRSSVALHIPAKDEESEEPVLVGGISSSSSSSSSKTLRLPGLIEAIAIEGRALRWDAGARWYEVLNGSLFEDRCATGLSP